MLMLCRRKTLVSGDSDPMGHPSVGSDQKDYSSAGNDRKDTRFWKGFADRECQEKSDASSMTCNIKHDVMTHLL